MLPRSTFLLQLLLAWLKLWDVFVHARRAPLDPHADGATNILLEREDKPPFLPKRKVRFSQQLAAFSPPAFFRL